MQTARRAIRGLDLTLASISAGMKPGRLGAVLRSLMLAFVAITLAACSTSDAMRVAPMPTPSAGDSEKYAALVIDGNTGRTLHAVNAEELRYPASLTKMMALYMLFEAMQAGQVTPDTQIPVSQHAAAQPPSKLRLRAGDSIDARSAVQALATKSANISAARKTSSRHA
jgi:D-alanyl-D-alanine carboxypeptidase